MVRTASLATGRQLITSELDRLAKSAAQSDGRNVAGSASVATLWLLSVNRLHRERGHGVLRCQRWVERLHTEVGFTVSCFALRLILLG